MRQLSSVEGIKRRTVVRKSSSWPRLRERASTRPLVYAQTRFIWGKCDLRRQAATTPSSIGVPGVASAAIVKQIMLCDGGRRKKKTIQKVICDLWDQCRAASVTSEHHMSVSNGKRYAVEPACRVIKAGALYVHGGAGAVTGTLWSHRLSAEDSRSRAVNAPLLLKACFGVFFYESLYSIKYHFNMRSVPRSFPLNVSWERGDPPGDPWQRLASMFDVISVVTWFPQQGLIASQK